MARTGPTIPQPMTTINHLSIARHPLIRLLLMPREILGIEYLGNRRQGLRVVSAHERISVRREEDKR